MAWVCLWFELSITQRYLVATGSSEVAIARKRKILIDQYPQLKNRLIGQLCDEKPGAVLSREALEGLFTTASVNPRRRLNTSGGT